MEKFYKLKMFFILFILIMTIIFCINHLKNSVAVSNFDVSVGKKLPIIMYHHVSEKQNLLNDFTITPEQFENDLIYIRENGYESISMEQLLDYLENGTPLPNKPIMITFDDGHESFYHYIYPILKKYDEKAILSVVGEFSQAFSENEDGNIDYSYLTWSQINELSKSENVEIGNHTYSLHSMDNGRKGCDIKYNEDISTYKEFLENDVMKLENNISNYTGLNSAVFTYPYGIFSDATKETIIKMGFNAIFTCFEVVNIIEDNTDFLYNLGRFNRPNSANTEAFFNKIFSK